MISHSISFMAKAEDWMARVQPQGIDEEIWGLQNVVPDV
jgi:hypothetical protein